MYNQEVKERYLAGKPEKTAGNIRNLFEFSAKLEEESGVDIAEFTLEEMKYFANTWGFSEPDTIRTRIGMLISYADWYCEELGTPGHHIREYTVDMFPYAKCFAPTVTKTPEELINKIEQVYTLDSGQPAIAALCLAWVGIDSSVMLKLRNEQVDVVHGKVYDATGGIMVNQMPACIQETLAVYSKTRTAERTQNKTFTVYTDDLGFFLKRMVSENSGKRGKPITTTQVAGWITMLRKEYEKTLGSDQTLVYPNVQRSGRFYRLHELAKSGVDVRNIKNADKVRMCLGQSKRNHKDNMRMYDAYLEVIGEKQPD